MLCVFQLQDEYIKIRDQTRKSRGIQVKSKMGEYRQQLGNKKKGSEITSICSNSPTDYFEKQTNEKRNLVFGQIRRQIDFS